MGMVVLSPLIPTRRYHGGLNANDNVTFANDSVLSPAALAGVGTH